jgi:CrcB protein
MDLYKILAVGGGGMLGSISRYVSVRFIDGKVNTIIPYGTLCVNLLGSFILGVLYGAVSRNTAITENWKIFLGAGFCGGFTTFSAFALENFNLLEKKFYGSTLIYISVSLVGGIVALAAGNRLGRFL